MEKTLKESQKTNRIKNRLLSKISMEMRSPINTILGFIDIIHEQKKEHYSKEELEYFKIVVTSGLKLKRIANEIIDFMNIESGQIDYSIKQINLSDLIENIILEHESEATSKDLEIVFESSVESPYIDSDEQSLTRAIAKLIENAVISTPKGKIELSLTSDEDEIVLSIQHPGTGFSEDTLKIQPDAQSFYDLVEDNQSSEFGVGLSIIQKYLEKNKVSISSQKLNEGGFKYSLRFNSSTLEEKQTIPFPAASVWTDDRDRDRQLKPMILVVEDDINFQKLLGFVLGNDYDVMYSVSVDEARQKLKEFGADIILLDISLQGDEDGISFLNHLRKTDQWKDIPVIVVTAHAFMSDKEHAFNAGCSEYMVKPLMIQKLLNMVKRYTVS